jgi:hypothetical protein
MQEFEDTEERLKEAEKRIEDVRSSSNDIDYDGIEDLTSSILFSASFNLSSVSSNSCINSLLGLMRLYKMKFLFQA